MDDRAFNQLINRVKDAPELGGGFSVEDQARARARLVRDLGWDETPATGYTLADYLGYAHWEVQEMLLRPTAAVAGMAGLMLSGWVATVSAGNSLPGDVLYPVKLAGERVQIRLADTSQDRIRLHGEFAERRLQEAIKITQDTPDQTDRLKTAIAGFKGELNSAHGELETLQAKATSKEAVGAAAAINRKTAALTEILDQANPTGSQDVNDEVATAREAVKAAEEKTVGALVQTFETAQEPASVDELKRNFQQEYQRVQLHLTLNRGRLAALRTAAQALPEETGNAYLDFVSSSLASLLALEGPLADAVNIQAAGGYRRAFELLHAVGEEVEQVEQAIAPKEIELTTAHVAPAEAK